MVHLLVGLKVNCVTVYCNFCLTVSVFNVMFAADREVQRILLELLNQMDGFDQTVNVKVCCLNSASALFSHLVMHQLILSFASHVTSRNQSGVVLWLAPKEDVNL